MPHDVNASAWASLRSGISVVKAKSAYVPHMGRLALTVSALVTTIAVGGVFSAQGGVESGAGHGPGYRGFSAFAINSQNPQIVYAGSGRGVFKSSDGGGSWQAVNAGLTDLYIFDLAIDQHHPATMYAATGHGVFKSTNAARSWQPTNMPSMGTVALALHPRNARIVYATTDEGVFKSSDGGISWRAVTADPAAVRVFALALDPKRPATVYAGAGGGVFKTTNGGRSWRVMNRGFTPDKRGLSEGSVGAFTINPKRPQTLYAGAGHGVFKTTDGAQRWRAVNNGLIQEGPGAGSLYLVGSLAIDPQKPGSLYVGTYSSPGLFKTTNGGRNWSAIGPPGKGNVLALALDPTDSSTVYAGMFDGAEAFKSTDGGRTWRALAIPVP
jgi:photosystem II stability/assembly factor-like uncharacterized protein